MKNTITCPHCGEKIEVSEVLRHEVEGDLRKSLETELRKELQEASAAEMKDLKNQLAEKAEKVAELRDQELKLRQERRKLEDREKDLKLDLQRQLDSEKIKLEEAILKQAAEEHRLRDLEKEKKIADLQKQLEEALRKSQIGSQQMQGEILELDLELTLLQSFPNDEIKPVGKGVKGADVRQVVKSPKGYECGTILWETKRTKNWTDGWITKLKSDLRSEKDNIPVIVSEALPEEAIKGIGVKEGVWVCSYGLVIPVATMLRKSLLDAGFEKVKAAHRGEKSDYLYDYVTSHEFRQQLEGLVEVYNEMRGELDREKRAYERIWKAREGQIQRLMGSTANIVGSIQGKVGQTALQIKGLELLELEDGE
jgi:hypothetical protein